jgi:chaperone BCS1
MDVWVNFTHTTKWQAEWLFKLFFLPSRPSASSPNKSQSLGDPWENLPRAGRGASVHAVPVFEEAEIIQLAQRFANAIPEGEMSVWPILSSSSQGLFSMHGDFQFASLQGYLLKNRRRPRECVEEVTEWCGTVNCKRGTLTLCY